MASYTDNLNLIKPGSEDFYNIEDFNYNSDILDEEVSKKASKVIGGTAGDIATLDANGNIVDSGIKTRKKLWSGNWSTGSITVPGASDYMLFVFRTRVDDAPQNFTAIGFKVGGDIRLLGGRGQASGSQHIVGIECSASGDVFSDLVVAGVTHTAGGNHGSVNVYNIYEIYGIC